MCFFVLFSRYSKSKTRKCGCYRNEAGKSESYIKFPCFDIIFGFLEAIVFLLLSLVFEPNI